MIRERVQYSLQEVLGSEGPHMPNPHWEKWGRGRPSKAAKEKRAKSIEWEQEMSLKYPTRKPFLSFLVADTNVNIIQNVGGKVRMTYIPRST